MGEPFEFKKLWVTLILIDFGKCLSFSFIHSDHFNLMLKDNFQQQQEQQKQ